eukprot:CAMPEP_0185310334 /NCGR_PEP_ID=MMETSP1363-20130426/24770_1 /TAXON_ID=38817 /ORGANISM="Gephyrocapsa oceanica, Strain RCC1303" /LENGTH=51 /DNA_ID=CAMNT_0027907885 /DNA_START=60 /DNA_END=215 /DNA_ORIENTATION=-
MRLNARTSEREESSEIKEAMPHALSPARHDVGLRVVDNTCECNERSAEFRV